MGTKTTLPGKMESMETEYYLIRRKAVPETLIRVARVNRLLSLGRYRTVQEAVEAVGISRSSYYKFKDDITEFHDQSLQQTLTLTMEIRDESGVLSNILGVIARYGANILTIHQSIPIGEKATVSISIQVLESQGVQALLSHLKSLEGVCRMEATGSASGNI